MDKVVIGFSGGLDSTTLLAYYLNQNYEVHACNFTYGSKHNKYEEKAVDQIIKYYKDLNMAVVLHKFNLENVFADFKSNLLLSGGEIPEGHYAAPVMALTVIPGRNLIFLSIMAGLAESIGAEVIGLGVHAGDHAIYPDCRPAFIDCASNAIYHSSDGKVKVEAPFVNDDKAGILYRGYYEIHPIVPYQLTRSCYKDQELSCGKCGTCVERIEAFHNLDIPDPIQYEI